MKAIIAAGGSGTRLRPLTFSSNKHLLPVANKPLILYPLEAILNVGVKEIGIIVNETKPAIEALLGNGSSRGVTITYIEQDQPLGLAHVVKVAQNFIGEAPFIFHLGDNIFTSGIKRPFDHFNQSQPDALLTLIKHKENFRLGVPYFDETGKLIKVVEKPAQPPNEYGIPGLYFFNHHVFEAFFGDDKIKPSARGELEITELYTYLLDHGYRVETEEVDGRWVDPGKFTDMLEANAFLLDLNAESKIEGEVDSNSQVVGKLRVGIGTRIINCRMNGPVDIANNCLVQDSTIGPHVSIESNCKIEGAKVVNSVIMADTTLMDINRQIKDSFIGKNTEVWEEKQDSVSLFIGDHCKIRLT